MSIWSQHLSVASTRQNRNRIAALVKLHAAPTTLRFFAVQNCFLAGSLAMKHRAKRALPLMCLLVIGALGAGAARPSDPLLGLPRAAISEESAAQIRLGRKLFLDTRLSRGGTVGCASCHDPKRAFTDGRPVSVGIAQSEGTRNAPSLINVGYATTLLWDGRRKTLEEQVAAPFTNSREHGLGSGSTAHTVNDLSGLFGNVTAAAGNGAAGAIDFFNGPSDNGQVLGAGVTIGIGGGAGAFNGFTNTTVTPLGTVPGGAGGMGRHGLSGRDQGAPVCQ
jgi:hypothetical protein